MKKESEIFFSGRFVACYMKVGTNSNFVEAMKLSEYSRSRSFLDLG